MDPITIAAFLAPFLPALLSFGSKVAVGAATKIGETAGVKLTEEGLTKAKAIWAKLLPSVEARATAKEAAADLVKAPDDADVQAAMRVQLKKILEADPALVEAIAEILREPAPDGTPGTEIVQHVVGNQNVVLGQVTGGTVIGNVTGTVNL